MPKAKLDSESKYDRTPVAKGLVSRLAEGESEETPPRVDRTGGDYAAGLITGASIITSGEALGHGAWIDGIMLQQVADAINTSEQGSKVRFAHPSLSGDGMGSFLGRAKNAFVVGDRVLADLHLAESATKSPDGNLAEYVTGLATEDPAAFGVSIAFSQDYESEEKFESQYTVDGKFVSPDPRNEKHLPHVRMSKLHAADVVDQPAANPSGLFHAGCPDEMFSGTDLLDFLSGKSSESPTVLGVNASRIKGLVDRYCDQYGLTLFATKPEAEKPADTKDELKRYIDAFGGELGSRWFLEGLGFSDCQVKVIEGLKAENEQLSNRIAAFSKSRGELEPLSGGHAEDGPKQAKADAKMQQHLGDGLGKFAASLKVGSGR